MRKLLFILLTICTSVSLISCGRGNDGSEAKDNNLPYVKGETLLVSHKDIITEIDTWTQTHYIVVQQIKSSLNPQIKSGCFLKLKASYSD